MELFLFIQPSYEGLMWVIAIGLTVLVLDVFFETEILSVAALLGISIYVSLLFDVSIKWKVLIALLCWVGITLLFYFVWKKAVAPAMRRLINTGADEAIHSAIGDTAEFRLIDGKPFAYWNGDLWPVQFSETQDLESSQLKDHQKVKVSSVSNGTFTITSQ